MCNYHAHIWAMLLYTVSLAIAMALPGKLQGRHCLEAVYPSIQFSTSLIEAVDSRLLSIIAYEIYIAA